MALFLGLDVGTSGAKVVIYNPDTRSVVSRGSSYYQISKSQVPGRAEQDPSIWIQGAKQAIEIAIKGKEAKFGTIKGIGVSGQQHGLVVLDKKGQVIRPAKLWCDVEAKDEAAQLSKEAKWTYPAGFTAPKIMWLKENEPENFARLSTVLLPHDFVNYYFTGQLAMECGDASGTAVFDSERRTFDTSLMQFIDPKLPSCFPGLLGPNEVVGTLLPDVAAELGLPGGVFVSVGGGDNMMSALGAGAVSSGVMVCSLGTSGTLFGVSAKPVLDPSGAIAPFCDATGQWLPLLCTMNCTTATQEVRQAFGLEQDSINSLAAAEPAGCEGLNMLPYLAGERTPNWPHASGALLGLRAGSLRPGLLYRAAMEGATFSLLAGLSRMKEYGVQATELRVVGGGSGNLLWRRILADAFQLPLRFPQEQESAALGAALQATAVAAGVPVGQYIQENPPRMQDAVVYPDGSAADAYGAAFQRHVSSGEMIFGSG